MTDVSVRFELHNGDCDQPGKREKGGRGVVKEDEILIFNIFIVRLSCSRRFYNY